MNPSIHIVLDTSGSMVEDSKYHSSIYLLTSLRRFFKEHNLPFSQWQWSDTLTPLEKISKLSWSGTLNSYLFHSFYTEDKLVLLISDGDLPQDMEFFYKERCYLLPVGEEDPSLLCAFPPHRLWLPETLYGHFTVFYQSYLQGGVL